MAYTTVNKHTDYFNTKTWTGTSDATTSVTGVGFQPDWVWVKNRDVADDHMLFDAVRGVTKRLFSNSSGAEGTDAQTLTSFDSDGFTTGNSRATGGDAGNGMVSWNWKANGAGSSNTDGSITSTVSANTTAGFSIVKYTGNGSDQTVGHGLGVAPSMIIIKCLTTTHDWVVYHQSRGNGKAIALNLANAEYSSTAWQSTSPTNQVFYIKGGANSVSQSGDFVAYCFAEKTGYSKFGSYTGNGNDDGTFVYTGFKPAFVLTKYATSTSGWRQILDNKRDVYNPTSHALFANVSDTEYNLSNYHTDYLSNGFKLRNTLAGGNTNGAEYIYMAFAEAPLVGTNGVTAKAR